MEMTQDELGLCVVEVRDQIEQADPDAYAGFITDAACFKVARTADVKATDALRAFRRFEPRRDPARVRPIPFDARKPDRAAVEAARVPCAPAT